MSRPASLISTLLVLGAAASLAAAEPSDPTVALRRALAEAEGNLERGEPEIAESRYRSALREGWLLLGALRATEGDLLAAARAFELAASSAADDRRALFALSLVELEAGKAGEAAILLRRLAARDPADVEVRQALSRALAAMGNMDEAIQELEEVRILAPERLELLFSLATAYLRQGRLEAARPLLDRLAAQRPKPETYVLVGRTYRDHAHYELARRALEKALELAPEVPRAHYYLGTVELLAEGRGRIEEAIRHFREELARSPDDPMSNLYLGIALVESRRHEEAVGPLATASRSALAARDAFQFLGRAYLALDRPGEAVDALRRALELARERAMAAPEGVLVDLGESQLSSIHYQLGLALRRSGNPEDANVHFAEARDHSARLAAGSREMLERYLSDAVEPGEAEPMGPALEFAYLARLEPAQRRELGRWLATELARTYLNLGVFKIEDGRFGGAAELLFQAAELDPALPQVERSLGVALFNDGRYQDATAPLAGALERDPADATSRRLLALAYLHTEAYAEAAELLATDAERQVDPSLEYAYGLALVRSGRAAEAEGIFARLVESRGDWPELNVVLGQAHAQQGDYDAAIRSLARALELKPDVAEAHAALGDIFLRQGRLPEAEEALRAELAAHPADERARYTLALVLDMSGQPEEAETLLQTHLRARPRSADGRYLLGKILLAEGSAEDALEQLRLAAELAPGDPNVRYQLGQALLRLGRAEEAEREFETFRSLKRGQPSGDGP